MGQINDLIDQAHSTAKEKRFWDALDAFKDYCSVDDPTYESLLGQIYGNRLMHVTRELGEAWEELRVHGITEEFKEELADSVIVLFDFCGATGIRLEDLILAKMDKNKSRPEKHGKRF